MKSEFSKIAVVCSLALGSAFAIEWSIGSAHAQSSCILECRDKGWSYGQCNRYCATRYGEPNFSQRSSQPSSRTSGARVYGYRAPGRGSCGQYQYVKGGKCVDARTNPPSL